MGQVLFSFLKQEKLIQNEVQYRFWYGLHMSVELVFVFPF
jgi:hypothetical protein